MASNVEELTIEYKEDDQLLLKVIDKEILSKGAWATILYRYQEFDRNKQAFGEDKFSIRRYQKKGGEYKQQSKFTISSKDQAQKIIDALQKWIA